MRDRSASGDRQPMPGEAGEGRHGRGAGRRDQLEELGPGVRPPDRERAVMTRVPARRDEMDEELGADPAPAAAEQVVDDDPGACDAAELAEERDDLVRLEVVEDERGMCDVEGAVRPG